MRLMCLMQTYYFIRSNTYLGCYSSQICSNSSRIITTIRVDIQCCKFPFTHATMPSCTESYNLIGHIVIM